MSYCYVWSPSVRGSKRRALGGRGKRAEETSKIVSILRTRERGCPILPMLYTIYAGALQP